ncbi:MAG: LCP family protein, partial [Clostridia bacterium]
VPYYALVNKAGMGRVVDVVGGVELDVQADETSIRLSDGQLAFADAGLQWASGAQAVAYMDSREMDDDTQRNRRQRAVLDAILHKLSGGMRLSEALALGTELLSLVKTNVGFAEVLQAGMALIQKGYERPEQLRTPEKWVSRGVNFHIVAVADDMNAEIRRLKEFLYGKEEAS